MTQPRPLFVDTNAFVAIYDESDDHHERASAVISAEYDIEHVFAFGEGFRTLGMTRVPVDTGEYPDSG